MKRFALFVALLSRAAFGLAGAEKFADFIGRHTKEKKEQPAYAGQLLSQGVAGLVMMDEDPTVTSFDTLKREVQGFKAFQQEQCSAVHFKEPAWLVTTAHCFQGTDGKIDRFRQYARITIGGQVYTVDPLSIVIHPKHVGNSNPTQYDLAVFTVMPDQVATFDKNHTPIPLAPAGTYLGKGQLFYLAAYGSQNSDAGGWGDGRIKRFKMVSVPKSEQAKGTSRLFVSPSEQVILLGTDDNSPGINCLFDSGGAVVAVSQFIDGTYKYHLVGNIARKTGPAGNGQAKCESIDRYVVATDFRFQVDWLNSAIEMAQSQRREAESVREEFAVRQKALYGQTNPYALWVPTRKEVLDQIFSTTSALTTHEKSRSIFEYMLHEKKVQEAIPFLAMHSSQKQAIQNVQTLVQRPADPLRNLAVNQVEGFMDANTPHRYLNPHGGIPARSVKVTNIGDTTISFQSAVIGSGWEAYREDAQKAARRVLQPGQSYTVTWPQNQLKKMDSALLEQFEGDPLYVKVDFTLATQGEQNWLKQQEMGREWNEIAVRAGQASAAFNQSVRQYNSDLEYSKKANAEYNAYQRDDWTNEYYRTYLNGLTSRKNAYHAAYNSSAYWHKNEVDAFNAKWKTNYGYLIR